MRILVTPQRLRSAAQQLRSAASSLQQVGGRIGRAYNNLDAEARSVSGAGGKVREAQQRAKALADQAELMAHFLEQKAMAFEEADRQCTTALDQTVSPHVRNLMVSFFNNTNFINAVQLGLAGLSGLPLLTLGLNNANVLKGLHNITDNSKEAFDIIHSLRKLYDLDLVPGTAYNGQVIIRGGRNLREVLGLVPGVNHMRVSTKALFSQGLGLTKDAVKEKVLPSTRFGKFMLGADVLLTGVENWQTYKDEDPDLRVEKVVVGTVVDTAIKTTVSAIGVGVGSAVGGAALGGLLGAVSGGTLAPLGVALGSRVGGFAGNIAANYLYDNYGKQFVAPARDWLVNNGADLLDKGVDAAKEFGSQVADKAKEIGSTISQGVKDTARKVEEGIGRVTGGLSRLFR